MNMSTTIYIWSLLFWMYLPVRRGSWNYEEHGKDWTEGVCNSTTITQSPLDIDTSKITKYNQFYAFPRFQESSLLMNDANQTVNMEGHSGFFYSLEPYGLPHGIRYVFHHIEFHAPSEHTFDGKGADLEVQIYFTMDGMVNPDTKQTNGALSFFYDQGEESDFLKQFAYGSEDINGKKVNITLDYILPIDTGMRYEFFAYFGGYTRPPCDENVIWYLLRPVLQASPQQLQWFKDRWQDNPSFAAGNGNNRMTFPQLTKVYHFDIRLNLD